MVEVIEMHERFSHVNARHIHILSSPLMEVPSKSFYGDRKEDQFNIIHLLLRCTESLLLLITSSSLVGFSVLNAGVNDRP